MSYPDPRYLGAHGEASAVLRPADHPPEIEGPLPGQSAHYLATGASTDGAFGRAWRTSHAGDFLHIPPGGIHGFRNESGAPSSLLILFTPGAPREAYFEGLAEWLTGERSMSEEEMHAFLLEHDNIYVDRPD